MTILAPFRQDPTLRAIAALMMLYGAIVCSFGPYASVLAVKTFGLGDRGFAVILAVSSVLSVAASVWVGIRTDQKANRRVIALASTALLVAGLALMALAPGAVSFVIVHAVILPLSGTMFGQLFALARLVASTHPPQAGDAIMATVRALFALPFIAVLPLWSVAFAGGAPIIAIYPVALVMAGLMAVLVLRGWPHDGATVWEDRPSGLSFRAALAELARPALLGRVLALGAVNGAATIYIALVALILSPEVGRGPQDVALYVALVAGLEVPFMLAMPMLSRHLPRTPLIVAGTAVYVTHIALMPLLAASGWLWVLVLPAAIGGAVTLTLPIAYLQDLLSDRPGTGAALMALQRLAGEIIAALCFAVGTAVSGYGLAALLGSLAALAGAGALWLVDRRR